MSLFQDDMIRIEKLTLGPYETNAYILVCRKTGQSLVVDAPARAPEIIACLDGTEPKYILLTHDHYDHTGVIVSLRARLKVPLATHLESSYALQKPPEILLQDGDSLTLGKVKIDVLFTPGHTPGSLCFKAGNFLFAGDTLFPGGPGHTETPDEFRQIITSITEKIFRLPDDTMVLPGHGDGITIGNAKKEYAVFASHPHDEMIFGDVTWQSS